MLKKQAEVIGVIGKRGFGKSVWFRRRLKSERRVFAFDPVAELDAEYVDYQKLLWMYDRGEFGINKKFRIAISDPAEVELLASIAYLSGDNILAIEECAIAFDNPRAELDGIWKIVIFLGRHRGVSVLFTAQRAVSIPISCRSQFSRMVSFAQHEGSDIQWLRSYFGNAAYTIAELPALECIDAFDGVVSRYKIPYEKPQQNHPLNIADEDEKPEQVSSGIASYLDDHDL